MSSEQPNFYSLISDKTEDFAGREWVFNEIDNWLDSDPSTRQRYFIITGKAGSGKSTIAARLIEISIETTRESDVNNDDGDKVINIHFKKIKKDFIDAFYVISFKDNLSTDAKTFSEHLSDQLAHNNTLFAQELINSKKTSNVYDINIDASQKQRGSS